MSVTATGISDIWKEDGEGLEESEAASDEVFKEGQCEKLSAEQSSA